MNVLFLVFQAKVKYSEMKNELPVLKPSMNNSNNSNLQIKRILVKVIYYIKLFVN